MSLAARLRQFEEGRFDLEADLGSLTEKGVETLRGELGALDAEVGTQLRSAVGTHYADFVKATPGILRLEGEVQQLRNLLHTMGDVVEGLKEVSAAVSAQSATAASQAAAAQSRGLSSGGAGGRAAADVEAAWRAGGDGAKWLECLDDADVAVAERRLSDALALLRRLERLLSRFVAAADAGDPAQQARLDSLSGEVERRREALIAISEQQVLQPTAASPDICAGADLLGRLAGQPHALVTVLEAHAAKLKRHQAALLRPAASGGGDADGSDYAAALGQKLALALAAAADDLHCVFGSGAAPVGGSDGGGTGAELDAAFLVWALHQTERTCHLLRKHALLPFAAPAGLHAFCRCAFAFAAHAAALEGTHGLQLMPTVHRELWPVLEQVLARRVRKLGDALRKAAVAEVEAIAGGAVPPPADPSSWECLETTFPSANYFLDELEGMAAEGRRLASPRLLGALRKAVCDLFQLYTASLAAAINRGLKAHGMQPEAKERLAAAAEGAMELSTLLLERMLPEALAPLSEVGGQVCSSAVLGQHLERMGAALGFTALPASPPFEGGSSSAGQLQAASLAAAATSAALEAEAYAGAETALEESSEHRYRSTSEE
ncbi:exocyst complex component EXO84B-like [Micractinium conductrix]|uniref:Exocyst complex component EXO84B-like n=1 Tax=Micractinium conductrix TaxID=554055 RepID=A0A2P6V014_9CHLO|nr:exocyst complex component EXO84B-like [Micractinium conductrix]|eukprot:PSC67429.1 exocyst complex component EXO84B-like [Micractinium conductrix]